MNCNLSASISKCRPSVIKWVGKDFTADINCNKKNVENSFIVSNVNQPCTRSAQELHERAGLRVTVSDEPRTDQLTAINKESLFPKSKNAENKYVCMICKRCFKWRSHWKSHERIHSGERPFKCEICGKAFTRSDGLQSHKNVHIKITKPFSSEAEANYVLGNDVLQDITEKVFICAYCGRTFVSLAGYCRHTDGHKGKEDLKCHICNIIFNRPSALEIHNRVHTGLKPYRCNICSKAFSVRGNLKRHLLIHTGEKPYNCTYCSSSFNNSSHLARHTRFKHQKQSLSENKQS